METLLLHLCQFVLSDPLELLSSGLDYHPIPNETNSLYLDHPDAVESCIEGTVNQSLLGG